MSQQRQTFQERSNSHINQSKMSFRKSIATSGSFVLLLLVLVSWTNDVVLSFTTSTSSRVMNIQSTKVKMGMTTMSNRKQQENDEVCENFAVSSTIREKRTMTTSSDTKDEGISSSSSSSSPVDRIGSDQHEFELHVGHAMDVLRSDYQVVLTQNPDFSIYDKDLEIIDPSGVTLHGISNYRGSFQLLHAIVNIFYCPERSGISFRMCFDKARQNIRISWNAQVIPRAIFGGVHSTLHVDGISIYEISRLSGNVTQHRIEQLVINGNSITPEQGIVTALRGYAVKQKVDPIPVFNHFKKTEQPSSEQLSASTLLDEEVFTLITDDRNNNIGTLLPNEPQVVQFQSIMPKLSKTSSSSSLFASSNPNSNGNTNLNMNNNKKNTQLDMSPASSAASASENMDWEALERKNQSRKNFGLPPLSPEEFIELQKEVDELENAQRKRAAASAAELERKKIEQEKAASGAGGFFKKMLGNVLEDTCESNFDCERPQVCCDFGFKKMCCTSGMRVVDGPQSREGQLAEVPVIANPNPYPPNGGNNGGSGYPGLNGY